MAIQQDYADRSWMFERDQQEAKLKAAIEWLGTRWLLHSANHVQKVVQEPLPLFLRQQAS